MIEAYINKQPLERQQLLSKIHQLIIELDSSVAAAVEPMMGKEMIVYKAPGTFKYGLASVKNYMSLHVMPIYGSPALYKKYKDLLPESSFQKGCINFRNETEMPAAIVRQLITDCAKVDLQKIKEEYQKSRKK
jgi:hypothetical protein